VHYETSPNVVYYSKLCEGRGEEEPGIEEYEGIKKRSERRERSESERVRE